MSAARDRGRSTLVRELIELSPEALRGAIESFLLREGTDYGEREAYI